MSAPKMANRWGVLAKTEAPYGTFANPAAATDGIIVVARPDVEMDWAFDGARAHPTLKRVSKSGRFHKLALVQEPAGPGSAYAAANLPNINTLMRMAGFDVTVDTTAGAEKATYAPTAPGSYVGGSLEVYNRGQKYQVAGAYAQLKIELEAGGVPKFTFDAQGISQALPTDAPVPAITYAGAQLVDPAKADAPNLTIGGAVPARIKSLTLTQDRAIGARKADNTGGPRHGGFNPGEEDKYTLEAIIEATALATFNPYSLADLLTSQAVSFQVGATQYKKWTLTAPNAQLLTAPEQDEDNATLWAVSLECKPSGFQKNDEISIAFA